MIGTLFRFANGKAISFVYVFFGLFLLLLILSPEEAPTYCFCMFLSVHSCLYPPENMAQPVLRCLVLSGGIHYLKVDI